MKKFSVKDIMNKEPCEEYTEEYVSELWDNKDSLSLEEINKLSISLDDRLWILARLVSTEIVVKWAQYCANEAQTHANAAAYWAAAWAANAAAYANSAARYAARYAAAAAADDADGSQDWNKTRDKELERLLTKLIEMN